jgi:hypothetical protein
VELSDVGPVADPDNSRRRNDGAGTDTASSPSTTSPITVAVGAMKALFGIVG